MLSLILKKDAVKDVRKGNPWIWQGMIKMNSALETAEAGSLVQITDHRATPLGIGYINPQNILACRILSLQPNTVINQQFFYHIFKNALNKREKLFNQPFYRLVHSESDQMPGLIIDRFGDILVCQTSTAGMEKLKPLWLPALQDLLAPMAIVLRDDVPARKKEGLSTGTSVYYGEIPELVEVYEHNRIYYANLLTGQKTGWFYDQRANRTYLSGVVEGKEVLDLYSHSGGFGMAAGKGNAAQVTMTDSSSLALELAEHAAKRNGIDSRCTYERADAYEYLESCIEQGKLFDVVMADPPAFIKEKRFIAAGLKGYQKLAFLCAQTVKDEGVFCIASCSHHAAEHALQRAVEEGIAKAGRRYTLIHKAGADKDHPAHPALPESKYLKFLAYRVSVKRD